MLRALPFALAALTVPASAQVLVTEVMYRGADGEFVELTNVGVAPVDLTGWSLDDQSAMAGTLDLSPLGILAPGASAIVTESPAASFAALWGLSGVAILGDNVVARIGRNDEVHLYDGFGNEVDALAYGDEDFPGTPRSDGVSLNGCDGALGANEVYAWDPSNPGDARGSVTSIGGDVGNPGTYTSTSCPLLNYCDANPNATGVAGVCSAFGDRTVGGLGLTLRAWNLPDDTFGFFIVSRDAGFTANAGGTAGNLCLGGQIGRYQLFVQNTGTDGAIELLVDATQIPDPVAGTVSATPGETWRFQAWHRDSNGGVPTANLTNGLEVVWR